MQKDKEQVWKQLTLDVNGKFLKLTVVTLRLKLKYLPLWLCLASVVGRDLYNLEGTFH